MHFGIWLDYIEILRNIIVEIAIQCLFLAMSKPSDHVLSDLVLAATDRSWFDNMASSLPNTAIISAGLDRIQLVEVSIATAT